MDDKTNCLGYLIGCIYIVVANLNHYIKKLTTTTVTVERDDLTGLHFPAVTVSSFNAYESSEIAQITEFLFNPDLDYDNNAVNKSNKCVCAYIVHHHKKR